MNDMNCGLSNIDPLLDDFCNVNRSIYGPSIGAVGISATSGQSMLQLNSNESEPAHSHCGANTPYVGISNTTNTYSPNTISIDSSGASNGYSNVNLAKHKQYLISKGVPAIAVKIDGEYRYSTDYCEFNKIYTTKKLLFSEYDVVNDNNDYYFYIEVYKEFTKDEELYDYVLPLIKMCKNSIPDFKEMLRFIKGFKKDQWCIFIPNVWLE